MLVTGLVEGSPADTAGLLVGDMIVGFEGGVVQEPEQLVMRLRGERVGKPAARDHASRRCGPGCDGHHRRAPTMTGASKLGSPWPIPFVCSSPARVRTSARPRPRCRERRKLEIVSDPAWADVVVVSPEEWRGCAPDSVAPRYGAAAWPHRSRGSPLASSRCCTLVAEGLPNREIAARARRHRAHREVSPRRHLRQARRVDAHGGGAEGVAVGGDRDLSPDACRMNLVDESGDLLMW